MRRDRFLQRYASGPVGRPLVQLLPGRADGRGPGWRWQCRYIDGAWGQHSTWHYTVDDSGSAPSYAEALEAALLHVVVHLTAHRAPGRFERAVLAYQERRSVRRLKARGLEPFPRWWS